MVGMLDVREGELLAIAGHDILSATPFTVSHLQKQV